jgi:hypothetical protein
MEKTVRKFELKSRKPKRKRKKERKKETNKQSMLPVG